MLADTPPVSLIHANDDEVVPVENSLLFYQALMEKQIPCEMNLYQEGGHGFGLALSNKHLHTCTGLCLDWLQNLNE